MTLVRPARSDDADAVADVQSAATRTFGPAHYTDEQLSHWARARDPAHYDFDDGVHLVAERDGEAVGWGWVVPECCEVRAVYVHPDHAREGVGSRLLDRLEARARDDGCSALSLWSSLPARRFYAANGYDNVRRVELSAGDVSLPAVVMRKRRL